MKTNEKKIRLLKKISQKQLFFGLIIVFGSLVVLYFFTRFYIIDETEESLRNTTFRIEQLLINNKKVASLSPLFEVTEISKLRPETIKDTLIFDELQNEDELFRELNTYKTLNGKNYHIVTRALLVESDDTLVSILLTFTIIIILVFLAQFYFSKQTNKMIWKPFFQNLDTIKSFSIRSNEPIDLKPSDILEFSELNTQIEALTTKVATDYQNLKQFTEDLSHEVQTPLSIIQAKIENLIDDSKQLDETHLNTLHEIQKNSKRLSKLNKGLILLTKIDNQQFNELETIDVNMLVNSLIEDVQDIADIKNLTIKFSEKSHLKIIMDRALTDVLFSNLIGNAIKHTAKNSDIHIQIESNSFTISNSGDKAIANSDQLFQRFYKEDKHSQSLGLGLAIVKKICDFYGFEIQYQFTQNQHHYILNFPLK